MRKYGLDRHARQRYGCNVCHFRVVASCQLTIADTLTVYKPEKLYAAQRFFQEGHSIRFTAQAVGISKRTAETYRKLLFPSTIILCSCGKPAGHKGWCAWRIALSPARQEWYARCAAQSALRLASVRPRLEPILTTWPFVRSFDNDDYALLKAVNEIVPRSIPEHVRADVCQDILMDIVSGKLALETVPHRMKEYTRKAYGFMPSKFGPKSLDSFIFGDKGRTLADVLEG